MKKLGKIYQCNAGDVRLALRKRFAAPEWALFFEVANGTGANASRYADAIGMQLWESRGLGFTGFEIKVRRGDWLKELRDPAKAEEIAQFCRNWYIVAAKGIVLEDELPELWGLIELDGRGLRVVKKAPELDVVPATIQFIAALLRRAGEYDREELRSHLKAQEKADKADVEKRVQDAARFAGEKYDSLKKSVDEFEKASGIRITRYNGANVAADLALLNEIGVESVRSKARALRQAASVFVDRIDALTAEEDADGN